MLPPPPPGGFPEGSPYAWGWLTQVDSGVFDGGTPGNRALPSVSQRVVYGNDTGKLDTTTVDLAPNIPGIQHEIVVIDFPEESSAADLSRLNPYNLWRYTYDPVQDTVTIASTTWADVPELDTQQFDDAWDAFYVAHGENPSKAEDQAFCVNYINTHSQGTIAVSAENSLNEEVSVSALKFLYDIYGSSVYVGAGAYELRIPYVVQSIDGVKSTGADIIMRYVNYYTERT